ncbi:DUF3105 domain-containing protein [Microbispora hainanensis]|jgi:hypothetical protein|uniref:DUF3105 domain-containing protein n=1 Tax=Microbispora hainanensis TaxID=568844 RepID=A0ABZ1SRJ1_9ACTN|nr:MULTISPECIES: DUF3105 domain-containing protein [Microbispora]NJP22654.1 DUF3105 domain-containing protein [Microbispora sp. CL1-1]TQS16705.1 DUF3105 domain-containing protein [Microbispora sp. SCL1-1]
MTKEKAQARRDHLARMRAEQKRKERRAALLMWGIGGLVIVVLIALVTVYVINDRSAKSLSAVKTFNYKGSDHSWTKVSYKETPPVGGQHNFYWQNCGIYDKPIHNEHGVHSLEHGAVWITYQPDLPKAEVDKLKTIASSDYMLLSPYPNLPSKIVVSSWNHQLALDSADDPRLPEFVKKYKQNPTTTPEYGASCSGGIGTTDEQPLPSPQAETTQEPMPSTAPSS